MTTKEIVTVEYEDINISITKIQVQLRGRWFPPMSWQASGYVNTDSYSFGNFVFSGFGMTPRKAIEDALRSLMYKSVVTEQIKQKVVAE